MFSSAMKFATKAFRRSAQNSRLTRDGSLSWLIFPQSTSATLRTPSLDLVLERVPMQVPAILYGDAKEVRARCRTVLRGWLKSDVPYIEAMEANGMLDVADIQEPMNLEFGPRTYGFGPYLAAPVYCLFSGAKGLLLNERVPSPPNRWSLPRLEQFFDASYTRPWALMSIIYTQNAHLFFTAEHDRELARCRRLTASVLRDCDELEAVGPRYYPGANYPTYLAHVAHKVYQSSRTLGTSVDSAELNELLGHRWGSYPYPEPKGGLRGVLTALGVVVDPAWAAERLPDQPTVLIPQAPPPPPLPYDPSEHEMSPAMQTAIETDDTATVRQLIEGGESPDRYHPSMLATPLFWAIQQGHTELVEFLLDHGANIEDRADEGESPLMKAALYGHRAIVRLLIERGAKVRFRTDKGFSAIEYAEMGKDPEIQELIAAAYKAKKRRPPTT
jgi:hypothetical protein